jgi:hypothetical protein
MQFELQWIFISRAGTGGSVESQNEFGPPEILCEQMRAFCACIVSSWRRMGIAGEGSNAGGGLDECAGKNLQETRAESGTG